MSGDNIFSQTFDTREAALEALGGALEERDGKFSVGGTLRKAFDDAGENAKESQKYRTRAQTAEKTARDLESQLNETKAQLQELLNLKPEELRGQLEESARERGKLKNQLDELTKALEPLKAENEAFKAREAEAKIVDALRQAAAELGVRAEATRDVERLKALFAVSSESGEILDASGRDVKAVVAAELKESPHWLPQSTGGGSTGGGAAGAPNTLEGRYNDAKARGDVAGMLAAKFGY